MAILGNELLGKKKPYASKVLALSPLAYWKLNDLSGTTAMDASGNSRSGTYSNVALGQTGIGDGNTAAGFNGSSSNVAIWSASLAGAFNGNEFTVAAWVKFDSTAFQVPLTIGADGSNRMLFSTQGDGTSFICYASQYGNLIASGLTLGAWHHYALSVSQSVNFIRLYVDGARIQDKTPIAWTGAIVSYWTNLGNITGALVLNGSMAHTAIFGSALSDAQIATIGKV